MRYNTREALTELLDDVTHVQLMRELLDWCGRQARSNAARAWGRERPRRGADGAWGLALWRAWRGPQPAGGAVRVPRALAAAHRCMRLARNKQRAQGRGGVGCRPRRAAGHPLVRQLADVRQGVVLAGHSRGAKLATLAATKDARVVGERRGAAGPRQRQRPGMRAGGAAAQQPVSTSAFAQLRGSQAGARLHFVQTRSPTPAATCVWP
jgi:hypothetical protein